MTKSRTLRWAGHVASMEKSRNSFKILASKLTGKRPLGRPTHRWDDNVRMASKVIGINTRNCVDSALSRNYWRVLANVALNRRIL